MYFEKNRYYFVISWKSNYKMAIRDIKAKWLGIDTLDA